MAIGIGDAKGLPAARRHLPRRTGDQHQAHTGGEAAHDRRLPALYDGVLRRPRRLGRPQSLRDPRRLLGQPRNLPPSLGEPQQRQHRNEQGQPKEHRDQPGIPRLEPEPEVQPDAAVQPGQHQQEHLLDAEVRAQLPVEQHHKGVRVRGVEPRVGQPRAHDMGREQGRDGQAEEQLERFPRGEAEVPTLVQGYEGQRDMGAQRPVERDGPDGMAPHG